MYSVMGCTGINPIILIASCEKFRNNGYVQAVRDTWLRSWSEMIPYRFVLGKGCADLQEDEIAMDVPDSYSGMPWKTQAARRWASENRFDYTFHCCTDTFVHIPRLLSDPLDFDYCGFMEWDGVRHCRFAQGGSGYWLSPKAAKVVESAIFMTGIPPIEDAIVGSLLAASGLPLDARHDPRYVLGLDYWPIDLGIAKTIHLSCRSGIKYAPEWMYRVHAEMG